MACLSSTCLTPQEICFIVKGTTIGWYYTFKTSDGEPIPIAGVEMTFWMKQDVKSPDGVLGDLKDVIVFPDTPDSALGLGTQLITPTKTNLLIACKTYNYRFTAAVDIDSIYTMGLGRVQVII